jgi:hypothetical protein
MKSRLAAGVDQHERVDGALGMKLLARASTFVLAACFVAGAQSSPEVHLNADGLSPRPIEALTGTTIVQHYAQAWRDMTEALESGRADKLTDNFVGSARDRLKQRVGEQARAGIHIRIVDHGHQLKAIFYSTDGTAMQLIDQAQLEIRTFDGDKLLDTENAPHKFVVLMTPGADRWYIRDFEDVSGDSF